MEDALDEIFKLGYEKCGDLYARIDPVYAKKMLDATEERIKSLYGLTWAVEISFMIEIAILFLILLCACCSACKLVSPSRACGEFATEFRAFMKAYQMFN